MDNQYDGNGCSHARINIGDDIHCPCCGEISDMSPVERRDFTMSDGETEWIESVRCPFCGQEYEFKNGDA